MALRVGINGLGRIGRCLVRLLRGENSVELAAINELAPISTVAHLLRHDSVHGAFPGSISTARDALVIDGREIPVTSHDDPCLIPWEDQGAQVVVEATGKFSGNGRARGHLRPGVRVVAVSAVCPEADRQLILGIDPPELRAGESVVALGSCTTHAAALPLSLIESWVGIESAEMTTVHCTTGSQMTMDGPHPDLRRARSALASMIPTSTSAAVGLVRALPALEGRLSCLAVRVPTISVSLVEIVAQTKQPLPALGAIVERLRAAEAEEPFAGRLGVSDAPLVSSDFRGERRSCVIDLPLLARAGSHLLRVVGWYDNEWGYASRLAELLRIWSGTLGPRE